MNTANGHANRFMGMEQCMDLENYWPPYWDQIAERGHSDDKQIWQGC
jgi:hypothetical protein